ncbi:unnamed protein product [Adineta ricciae]|uniref:Uncharacterized protein n=1 Tax=Adineta ricciae TaxID=249248 RepID=A0A814S3A5_ADIRI|nr:unnamed protein product [Adineta ricciae]
MTMPTLNKSINNQSVYMALKLPTDEELYIVDFHPIINIQRVKFISTYLCSKPYRTEPNFWLDTRACESVDQSVLIYEWYDSVPAVQWPKDAGLRVGINTPYRYVVVNVHYRSSDSNDIYTERITFTHQKPKYEIEMYDIMTNALNIQKHRVDFSCQYDSSEMKIFSTLFSSNFQGGAISLYRIRNNQVQSIIKGNLAWPQTFYQLSNVTDIKGEDYLIGLCAFEKPIQDQMVKSRNFICQLTLMFYIEQEEKLTIEGCENNDFSSISQRFLPVNALDTPQTLFDINPIYPKLPPNEWMQSQLNKPLSSPQSTDNDTQTIYLIYTNQHRYDQLIIFMQDHPLISILILWLILLVIGLVILVYVIRRARRIIVYSSSHIARPTSVTVGGDTSSLSGWLTKRRFQQYGDDDSTANVPLTSKHRWASDTEGSDLSDTEVFNTKKITQKG